MPSWLGRRVPAPLPILPRSLPGWRGASLAPNGGRDHRDRPLRTRAEPTACHPGRALSDVTASDDTPALILRDCAPRPWPASRWGMRPRPCSRSRKMPPASRSRWKCAADQLDRACRDPPSDRVCGPGGATAPPPALTQGMTQMDFTDLYSRRRVAQDGRALRTSSTPATESGSGLRRLGRDRPGPPGGRIFFFFFRALDAAARAMADWSARSPRERSEGVAPRGGS